MVEAKDDGLAQDANEFVALVGAYGHRHDGQAIDSAILVCSPHTRPGLPSLLTGQ